MNVEKFHERLQELYLPPQNKFTIVKVPQVRYMAIGGHGTPDPQVMRACTRRLYAIAHIVKPIIRERMGKRFVEPPLECIYRTEDGHNPDTVPPESRQWKVMIVLVDWVSKKQFNEAVHTAAEKLGPSPIPPSIFSLNEGRCTQIMHVGDYAGIKSICRELYERYLPENNLVPDGWYHEIYLNDPARTAPEKRKVVIRQPVKAIQ